MQTFLPYPNFAKSAKVLDYRRLGKQRIECKQLLLGQWQNHPASKMWRGFEFQLSEYGKIVCLEWRSRGYKDNQLEEISNIQKQFKDTGYPPWFGREDFHLAHQSNLLRKNFEYYSIHFPNINNNLPYLWK